MTEHPRSTVFERTGSFADLIAAHEEHKRDIADTKAWLDDIGRRLGAMPQAARAVAFQAEPVPVSSAFAASIPIAGEHL